jgi:hypothetical protein
MIISSCCKKDKYHYISDEDKLIYKVGDTLIYKSNLGNQDTVVIVQILQQFQATEDDDFCKTQNFHEFLEWQIEAIPIDTFCRYVTVYSGTPYISYVCWLGTSMRTHSDLYYTIIDSMYMQNITFYNIFRSIKYPDWQEPDNVDTLWFDKNYGVIKYSKINSEEYELIF